MIIGPVVAAPAQQEAALSVFPNPFNPSTVVEFTATPGSRGSVRVFNLRGELVRTLHSGEFQTSQFRWDGTDQRGAAVASGVYVVQADMEGAKQTRKVALVK
jgi:flagellar hook assembly protein FlgD